MKSTGLEIDPLAHNPEVVVEAPLSGVELRGCLERMEIAPRCDVSLPPPRRRITSRGPSFLDCCQAASNTLNQGHRALWQPVSIPRLLHKLLHKPTTTTPQNAPERFESLYI